MTKDARHISCLWNGRNDDVANPALSFHSIEYIDEPRKEVSESS